MTGDKGQGKCRETVLEFELGLLQSIRSLVNDRSKWPGRGFCKGSVFPTEGFFASRDTSSSIWTQIERFGRFLCKILMPIVKKLGLGRLKVNIFPGEIPWTPGVIYWTQVRTVLGK